MITKESFIVTLLLVLVFTGVIKWELYKYHDCKKVGHSTIYCIFTKN